MKKLFVIAYDIVKTKTRTKVAKVLSGYGVRVQKSVFECIVDDEEFEQLKNKLEKLINFNEDSIRYYYLCDRCKRSIKISGIGTFYEKDDVVVI